MLTSEKFLRSLYAKMAELQRDIFFHPPKTMEEFNIRLGRFLQLHEVTTAIVEDAKGLEKE